MIDSAKELGMVLPRDLRDTYRRIYNLLTSEAGCDVHVKTIYVGFAIGGEMVAAMYPFAKRIELALALPESTPGADLQDATHLTWRTMPLSINIHDSSSGAAALAYARDAAALVSEGVTNEPLDNDHFVRSKRDADLRWNRY